MQVLSRFRNVLMICDELRRIGGDMFAIDGCEQHGNAFKSWKGAQ